MLSAALLFEAARLFEAEAWEAAAGSSGRFFNERGMTPFRSTFDGPVKADYAEADRLESIAEELREKARAMAVEAEFSIEECY